MTKHPTLADTAADYLREQHRRHPNASWRLEIGDPSALHEIYDRWRQTTGQKPDSHHHGGTMYPKYAVMRALGHTKRGRELFHLYGYINYPGIVNRPCPMYELREEHRERADG